MKKIILDGSHLTIKDIWFLAKDPNVLVDVAESAMESVRSCHNFLVRESDKKIIYGVNTGFGPMASHILSKDQIAVLQKNLIRSHAVGMGEPIESEYVLASMAVRLNTLVKGYSGVSPALVEQLKNFINQRIIPVVPEHGAVGASGDLVQLAHIALALIGEGDAFYKDKCRPVKEILKELDLPAYQLGPKEGLALINGTSTMTGIAALLCAHVERLLSIAVRAGALALELVGGFTDSISEELQKVRPHQGQIMVARFLRHLLDGSHMLRDRNATPVFKNKIEEAGYIHEIPERVQEVYSLRCIPQILGPVADSFKKTSSEVEVEMNAVTDNPVVDWEHKSFLHGGNFHGDYIAVSIDQLKVAVVKLSLLSERRINFFLDQTVNNHFPPFMNLKTPGLTLGLQGLQFVATSVAAQNQTLAFPHSVHSIPTNAGNQDVVSMGTDAALMFAKVVDNAYIILAIEVITLVQAVDFLGGLDKFSPQSKKLYHSIRTVFPKIEDDRVIIKELTRVTELLKNEEWLLFPRVD